MLNTRELELLVLLIELFTVVVAIIFLASGQSTRSGWISLGVGGLLAVLLRIYIWFREGDSSSMG